MGSILLAIAWAGAGSSPQVTSSTLIDLAVSLALTGLVAWAAHSNEQAKARRRERELAVAIPAAGVH